MGIYKEVNSLFSCVEPEHTYTRTRARTKRLSFVITEHAILFKKHNSLRYLKKQTLWYAILT